MRELLLAAAAVLSTIPFAASAQCNQQCVGVLQSRGVPPWDVQRQCCSFQPGPQYVPQQALTNRCITPYGACGMVQPIPVTSSCICIGPAGPIAGQAG